MDHSTRTALLYDAQKKSALVAYLLWFFVGFLGVHRFYLGYVATGLLMLLLWLVSAVLTVVLIGFVGLAIWGLWWIIDAFLIPGMAQDANMRLVARLDGPGVGERGWAAG